MQLFYHNKKKLGSADGIIASSFIICYRILFTDFNYFLFCLVDNKLSKKTCSFVDNHYKFWKTFSEIYNNADTDGRLCIIE